MEVKEKNQNSLARKIPVRLIATFILEGPGLLPECFAEM